MTLDAIPRWDPPTPDDLKLRMEDLASTLHVLNGMTKRGGVLPEDYRGHDVPAIRRMAIRVFEALESGTACKQPWDK
jgi:hypothetical protein